MLNVEVELDPLKLPFSFKYLKSSTVVKLRNSESVAIRPSDVQHLIDKMVLNVQIVFII